MGAGGAGGPAGYAATIGAQREVATVTGEQAADVAD